ncbi:MAG: enoyl-CoA hydratase/isomerase family protein [Candidatus Aquilonibacter sp.]|jgi:enoyl-CoA hydratase/carnithine racemase
MTVVEDGVRDGVRLREIVTASGHAFGHATLDRTASLNALNTAMIDRLTPALERWAADPGIVGVVLDGAGDRAFCAGGDVAALYHFVREAHAQQPGSVSPLAAAFLEREYRLDYRIHTFPKPLLCWGHGIVMGGGIGMMVGASHRVVVPNTRMAMPEISLGLYPDVGASWFLRRLPGRIGLFLTLTGATLTAADARLVGLADFTLPHEEYPRILAAIAERQWSGDRDSDASRLSHLLEGHAISVQPVASPLRQHFDVIDAVMGHDALPDIAARLRALVDHQDPWLSAAGKTFVNGSPTSAALSWELWRRSLHLSLAEVFRLEYRVSLACCQYDEFAEGVRAVLIDKDRRPRWQPDTLEAVSAAHVADHFRPRHEEPHPLADLR